MTSKRTASLKKTMPSYVSPSLLASVHSFFPSDTPLLSDGSYKLTMDETIELNTLFEQFGLVARVGDERFKDLRDLAQFWLRFANHFGQFVGYAHSSPELFKFFIKEWPAPYKQYLEAVMAEDIPMAIKLAAELDVENLSVKLPFTKL